MLFFWHWMGGDAEDFVEQGELATAVDDQRFIAIVPESIGAGVFGNDSLDVKWPFDITQSSARMGEELTFFDDMLACVAETLPVNRHCVASTGVSAGALWTDQLVAQRDGLIASFLSLSGGVGGIIKPWGNPERRLPGVVLWGGPSDNCFNLLKFDETSRTLVGDMSSRDHFLIECIHNCGHAPPPIDTTGDESTFAPLWQFVFDHPFWLPDGASPYLNDGLPENFPDWCGIGAGSATPREGECLEPNQCE